MADPRPLSASEMREARLRALDQTSSTPANTTTAPVGTGTSISSEGSAPVLPATDAAATPKPAPPDGLGEATTLSETELSAIRRLLWDTGAPEDDRRRWLVSLIQVTSLLFVGMFRR